MSTYVLLTKLTEKGYATTHHNPDRLDAVASEIQKLGVVVAQDALLGEWTYSRSSRLRIPAPSST